MSLDSNGERVYKEISWLSTASFDDVGLVRVHELRVFVSNSIKTNTKACQNRALLLQWGCWTDCGIIEDNYRKVSILIRFPSLHLLCWRMALPSTRTSFGECTRPRTQLNARKPSRQSFCCLWLSTCSIFTDKVNDRFAVWANRWLSTCSILPVKADNPSQTPDMRAKKYPSKKESDYYVNVSVTSLCLCIVYTICVSIYA